MDLKTKILTHLQANYCVKVGHPTDQGKACLELMYFTVAPKNGGKGRGEMNDDEWCKILLSEIEEEYTTDKFMLVIGTSNEFIKTLIK